MRDDRKKELQLLCMMIEHSRCVEYVDGVDADDFENQFLRKIFETVLNMYDEKKIITPVSVDHEIGASWSDEVLANIVTNGDNDGLDVGTLCQSVHNASLLRRIQSAATSIAKAAETGRDADSVLDTAMDYLGDIDSSVGSNVENLSQVFSDIRFKMENPDQVGNEMVVKTGIADLDARVGGLPRKLLTVLAGRPGMGKSTVVVNILANLANAGKRVFFTSLEDGNYFVGSRIISRFSGIDSKKFAQQKQLNLDEWQAMDKAIRNIRHENVWIDDSSGQTPSRIRRKVSRLIAKHRIDVLIIDHLGELADDDNEYSSTSKNVRGIRDIAKDFDIPVLLASQLNRQAEGVMPEMHHLQGSGKVEQVSRNIWMLFRPHKYDKTKDENQLIINVVKATHGSTGEIDVGIDLSTMNIYSRDAVHERYGNSYE